MHNRYLITGAAGFIGSYICRKLLERTDTELVVGIDSITPYYASKIKFFRLAEFENNIKFKFYNETITNIRAVREILETHKPTILIHAAAEVGVRNGEDNPLQYFSTNVIGTLTVLEASKKYIRHAIVFSSSSVYGNTSSVPFSEEENIHLSTPISVYGASKTSMELCVKNFFDRTGVPTTIVRPFSVYGPNGRPDMLPLKLLLSANAHSHIDIYSPSVLSRDWTYIDDFLQMFVALLDRPEKLQIINLGSGRPLMLKKVIRIAEKVIQKHGLRLTCVHKPVSPAEMLQTWANNNKIRAISNVQKFRDFDYGFSKTADFFFSHLDLYSV